MAEVYLRQKNRQMNECVTVTLSKFSFTSEEVRLDLWPKTKKMNAMQTLIFTPTLLSISHLVSIYLEFAQQAGLVQPEIPGLDWLVV